MREDLAKEKMVFSQESSQAFFEMGNVELIELKTSSQEMIRRIKAAFEIFKAPYFRTSVVTAGVNKHGPNLRQEHHHKAKDALRCTEKGKREFTSIPDRWQNDETYRKSQLAIIWSDAWVRYLDHVAQIYISHEAPHEQRNTLYTEC